MPAVWWFLRSANYNNSNNFCETNTDGSANNNNANYSGAVLAGFCVCGVTWSNRKVKDDPRKRRHASLAKA